MRAVQVEQHSDQLLLEEQPEATLITRAAMFVSTAEKREVKMSNGGSKGHSAATVVSTTGISTTLAAVATAAK